MAKKPSRTLNVYKSYSFTDKDPVIDVLRTAKQDSGLSSLEIHEKSDVSATTLWNWFEGKTKRPQMATVAAVGQALGYQAYDWKQRKLIKRS